MPFTPSPNHHHKYIGGMFYHSQSWLVYGIVLPTLALVCFNQEQHQISGSLSGSLSSPSVPKIAKGHQLAPWSNDLGATTVLNHPKERIYIYYIVLLYIYPNIYIYTLIINPNWGWFMIGVNPTLVNDTDTFHTTPHGESTAESSRKWNSHILVGGLMWFNGIFHGDYRGSINQKQGC